MVLYVVNKTVYTYDANTFKPNPPSWIVVCNDGKSRKFTMDFFDELKEYRDKRINELFNDN